MDNKKIKYISMGIGYSVGVIGILFTILSLLNGENPDAQDGNISVFFYACYFGILFSAGFAVLAGIMAAAKAPKKAVGSIGGIIALVAVIGISYAMSSDFVAWVGKPEEIASFNEQYTSGSRRFSGMVVNSMWILLILTMVTLVGSEVLRLIKSKK